VSVGVYQLVEEGHNVLRVGRNDRVEHHGENVEDNVPGVEYWVVNGVFGVEPFIGRVDPYNGVGKVGDRI